MIKAYRLVIPKRQLLFIPDEERVFLIYAGHILNEIGYLNRLYLILHQQGQAFIQSQRKRQSKEDEAKLDACMVLKLITTRLYTMKIVEATKFLADYFKEDWFKKLQNGYTANGKKALKKYKDFINFNKQSDSPLNIMRNKFVAHYDKDVAKLLSDDDILVENFSMILSEVSGNSLYVGSEDTFLKLYSKQLSQKQNGDDHLNLWIEGTLKMSEWITVILNESIAVLVDEHLSSEWTNLKFEDIDISTSDLKEITLPFFCKTERRP